MANVEADVEVQRFAYEGTDATRRLVFPRAQAHRLEGHAGSTTYGASECSFEGLETRLGALRWQADAASAGSAWLRDDGGRFDLAIGRADFPRGLLLTRGANHSVEILSPHVTLSEVKLTVQGPFGRATPGPAPPVPGAALRQQRLRFLDSLTGRVYVTLQVKLDLPVIGLRSLDQQLRVPIQEGSLDYRALDGQLDWLEGAFLDIKHEDQRLKVQWKVPIIGGGRDLISWALDDEASTLASFGRVPVRSLADVRIGAGPSQAATQDRRPGVLRAFTLDAIDVALSLLAPRHLEVGAGTIRFGDDAQAGMVDLKVSGSVGDRGPGRLAGAIGSIDTTIKDLALGSSALSADRLHVDSIDTLEVTFDGFRPISVALVAHRVTASNLSIQIGGQPRQPPEPAGAQGPAPGAGGDRTPVR